MTETQLEAVLEARDAYVSDLAHGNRRERQRAAHGLNLLAQEDVTVVAEVAEELVAALEHTEAQTQWECLNALAEIAVRDPHLVEDAFPVAEELLFEDGSVVTRMAAFRFVARYGAHGHQESERSWPLLRGGSVLSWRFRVSEHAPGSLGLCPRQHLRRGSCVAGEAHEL